MKIKAKIPEKAKIMVKPGQKVDFTTPLAETTEKQMIYIPIAEMLGFDAKNIFHHLKQVIGDQIQKGDVLAEKKSLFTTQQYLSEVSGILREIKHDTGIITIEKEMNNNHVLNCFFVGEISEVYDGYLELTVEDVHITKLQEETPYFGASMYYIDPTGKYSDADLDGACVFAPEFDPLDTVKIETLGAQGLITKTKFPSETVIHQIVLKDEKDFAHIQKKEYPYVLIGHEPMTILFYK